MFTINKNDRIKVLKPYMGPSVGDTIQILDVENGMVNVLIRKNVEERLSLDVKTLENDIDENYIKVVRMRKRTNTDELLGRVKAFSLKKDNNPPYMNMFLRSLANGDYVSCYQIIIGNAYYLRRKGIAVNIVELESLAENKSVRYHANNQIKSVIYYENGMMNGQYLTYYDNGQLKSRALYKNNEVVEPPKFYSKIN